MASQLHENHEKVTLDAIRRIYPRFSQFYWKNSK